MNFTYPRFVDTVKVAKFGGTSLATPANIRRVVDIIRSDPSRRVIVVSAPGKRTPDDTKITDLLIQLSREFDETIFNQFADRFLEIEHAFALSTNIKHELELFRKQLLARKLTRDYIISRGEYFMAKLMSSILSFEFIDIESTHAVTIKCRRNRCDGLLADIITSRENLPMHSHMVIPGFYGMSADGRLHAFSRGGSDISGAIVARLLKNPRTHITYENWTDVDGIFDLDPNRHSDARQLPRLTTAQAKRIINAGANVLHPSVFKFTHPVRIPIHIRNTFNPNAHGTYIQD